MNIQTLDPLFSNNKTSNYAKNFSQGQKGAHKYFKLAGKLNGIRFWHFICFQQQCTHFLWDKKLNYLYLSMCLSILRIAPKFSLDFCHHLQRK